jgi:hypothetical protein
MSRAKKLNIILPIVIILFVGAYARHKYVQKEYDIVGTLPTKQLDEISGIAASGINKDIYYIHNDSGDTSRFFAIEPSGKLIATIYFKGDTSMSQGVRDCEDIAVGPGPVKGKSYVYDGDIGDNDAVRDYITVYRIEEKKSWVADTVQNANAAAVPIHFRYPDGPKDAETLMIDPIEKLIYIISKRKDTVAVYTSPLIYKPNDTVMLTKRCKLFFSGIKPFKWITAGDISKDGQQILVKDYVKVYYWRRKNNEPVWQTLQRPPQLLPYKMEKQGEAIGFTPDGKGYYTTSEGVYSPIYYYELGLKN